MVEALAVGGSCSGTAVAAMGLEVGGATAGGVGTKRVPQAKVNAAGGCRSHPESPRQCS